MATHGSWREWASLYCQPADSRKSCYPASPLPPAPPSPPPSCTPRSDGNPAAIVCRWRPILGAGTSGPPSDHLRCEVRPASNPGSTPQSSLLDSISSPLNSAPTSWCPCCSASVTALLPWRVFSSGSPRMASKILHKGRFPASAAKCRAVEPRVPLLLMYRSGRGWLSQSFLATSTWPATAASISGVLNLLSRLSKSAFSSNKKSTKLMSPRSTA
mmetsp:Transcript_132261/g.300549  ORF Transcript_132261/g.300549 Transcript_132261/m.300549 type:complete len:215 (+) Transcript_132261:2-646(+)